jgi:uncharacterized membrane protein YphA (DoxX/SURF4 family)
MSQPRRIVFDESRYIPVVAVVLLVLLRLSIGWQFLYEGLWKYDTLSTPEPWTAAGYLKSAHGPFRNLFRSMNGDPDDLLWLDQKWVEARWDGWANRFADHYNLNKQQRARLNDYVAGPKEYRAELAALPAGVTIPKDLKGVVRFDAKAKRLIVNADEPITPADSIRLTELTPDPATVADKAEAARITAYRRAVDTLAKRSSDPSFKRRLRVSLGPEDPERVRMLFANFKGTLGDRAPTNIADYYKEILAAYEVSRNEANRTGLKFEQDHLAMEWEEIQKLRGELVNPIKALDAELKQKARGLLTADQFRRGEVPEPWTDQRIADVMTIVALLALGFLLMSGLATRVAAVMGAGMVLSFYLVWPPWPGVPEAIGPEHSYIVNKNLIEVIALLALAAMPTGQWFGLDGLFYRGWRTWRLRRQTAGPVVPATAATATPAAPAGTVREPAVAKTGR